MRHARSVRQVDQEKAEYSSCIDRLIDSFDHDTCDCMY
jgi:hypothetical protein